MKKIYIITLLTSATLFSQTELTKTLGEFSELKVYDLINVELFKGEEDKIIISGKNTKDVSVVQRNNILKIKMKINKKFKGAETKVKIYYTHIIYYTVLDGAESISHLLKQKNFFHTLNANQSFCHLGSPFRRLTST